MNTRHCQYIITIAEERSISRAAKKLYLDQSSLSHTLKSIEDALGTPLFQRSTPITPTYAGLIYIQTARQILMLERQLEQRLQDISINDRGRIVIGSSPQIAQSVLPFMLRQYREKYPHVEVVLVEGTRSELDTMLQQGEIDITFTTRTYKNPRIELIQLKRENLLMMIPKQLLNGKEEAPITFKSDLFRTLPFVLLKNHQELRSMVNNFFSHYGIEPAVIMETTDMNLCMKLASQGIAATIVTDAIPSLSADLDGLLVMPLGEPYRREICIGYIKDFYIPSYTLDFIEMLRAALTAGDDTPPSTSR